MQKACVIGWPIEHSRSPIIHGYWLNKYSIDGSYKKHAVKPSELTTFLQTLDENGFCGCNVTIPHKENVFNQIIVTDPVTIEIGAVNTVFIENGKLYGLNTDGYGFLSNLKSITNWNSAEKACAVIGAGGAARGIIAALKNDGLKTISVFNRTFAKAEKLATEFGPSVQAKRFDDLAGFLSETDLLVNTSSLGMIGQPPLELSLHNLPSHACVADIVYDPLETELLRHAKKNGNKVVDGLGMLLHQAVPGFEKWFGIRPEVTPELRDLIVADLQKEKVL